MTQNHDRPEPLERTGADAPAWANALEQRLDFFARDDANAPDHRATTAALRASAARQGDRVLQAFLHACLDEFGALVAARADMAAARRDLAALCALARTAIDGDKDDRPLLARAGALDGLPGPAAWAARAPGRVVWLAAMAGVTDEEGGAAAMLVNDLAALDPGLPLRAAQAALRA